jgi:hypothetical protein
MLTPYVVSAVHDPRQVAERFHFRLLGYGFEKGVFWARLEATPGLIEQWRRDPDGGFRSVHSEDDPQVPAWCRHPAARPGERTPATA